MRTVPREVLRRLRNDISVTDVVVELGVPTDRRGRRLTFRCPVCGRFQTAVNERANLGHCFRCERNFNPIDLAMAERGWTFLEAVAYLSERIVATGNDVALGVGPGRWPRPRP